VRHQLSQAKLERRCREFNERCPVGTPVHLVNDHGQVEHTRTRSAAWVLGGHTAVVAVEGRAGGYLLERITPPRAAAEGLPVDAAVRTGVVVAVEEAMARMGYAFASRAEDVPAGEVLLSFRCEGEPGKCATVRVTLTMEEG
jgi:hypothetical protein